MHTSQFINHNDRQDGKHPCGLAFCEILLQWYHSLPKIASKVFHQFKTGWPNRRQNVEETEVAPKSTSYTQGSYSFKFFNFRDF